jgi:hypothetical protein
MILRLPRYRRGAELQSLELSGLGKAQVINRIPIVIESIVTTNRRGKFRAPLRLSLKMINY